MSRDLILGQLDPDLACAVALGLVEHPRVAVSLEGLTLLDGSLQPVATVRDWLAADDPLDAATRAYLAARREATMTTVRRPGQSGWAAASVIKARDTANTRAAQARDLGRSLLAQRGVLAQARQLGLKMLGGD